MRRTGLVADPFLAGYPGRGRVRHELVGHQSVRDWLADDHVSIVIVADWMASNVNLLPALPIHMADEPIVELAKDQAAVHTARRLRHALAEMQLAHPWSAQPLGADLDFILAQRFGLQGAPAR